MKYDPKKIEKKWQKYWEKNKIFEVKEDLKKQKFYPLIEFPFISGVGLHVGHPRPFTAMDVIARKRRMEGYNVLYPIGYDSFGLPTENFAIKTGRPPQEIILENIANFKRQLKMLGYSFDWSREVDTSDPKYYKWTQWIFLQLFKHGLAYKKNQPINWCLNCKIGLANEEVVGGACERCGGPVEKRNKEQWMLAITKYADKLLEGLKEVDYITPARVQQENWIGRSEGAEVEFRIKNEELRITVFTTRPDTIFGATFLAVSAELAKKWLDVGWQTSDEVKKYIQEVLAEHKNADREEEKEKTGVPAGITAVNPVSQEQIPVWITNYVLGDVGTGAIMAVPAHDERDFEFAKKYGLPIKIVVLPTGGSTTFGNEPEEIIREEKNKIMDGTAFTEEGYNISSDFLTGVRTRVAKEKMIQWLEENKVGKRQVNYKLRDWVFSRQRYWGEPIPLVHCQACKDRKYNYIIIHGFGSSSSVGFKPWLKSELEKQGHTVWNPNLPNAETPQVDEQADFVINHAPFQIDEHTILVGHSLGGAVVYRVLEKIKTKIRKAVLVDPVYKPEFNDNPRPAVTASSNWKFDWKKIQASLGKCIVLEDKSNPIIKHEHLRELSGLLKGDLWSVNPSVRHFSSVDNASVTQEPEILQASVSCGWIPLPESSLPLKLPEVEKYEPTDTGESPLSAMTDWVNTKCPRCDGPARRETDTMPNWAGSSWYFLRYCDPNNDKEFASMEKLRYWMRVDWYNGGMEHTVLHLLYSRFWNQFLYDIGVVPTREPYKKRTSHGLILGPDGEKMSKSRGNVVNPDEMVEKFGTDAFRVYIGFMGPFDQPVMWDTNGLVGVRRFLERVWSLQEKIVIQSAAKDIPNSQITTFLHQTIHKVSDDIDAMRFNTAIAKLMELTNEMMRDTYPITRNTYQVLIKLLSPFAPHIAEELWEKFGTGETLAYSAWPEFDPELAKESMIIIVVQVNGKVRDQLEVPAEISEEEIKAQALVSEKVQKWLEGRVPKKVIYVKGKLVSVVI